MRITSRRRFRALLLFSVLVLSLVVRLPGAPKADAALHNLFPADVDGFPKGRFRADEAIFVTLTSDIYGGTVCVVPGSVTNAATADCGNPAWGKAKDYVGMGTLLGFPFAGGTKNLLRPGKWRLMTTDVAMPPDGDLITQASLLLHPEQRAPYKGKELSEEFEVVSCSPTCDVSKADSQLAPWKAMATKKVPSAAKENGALAWDLVTRTHKIMEAFYGGIGFGLSWGMMAAGVAGLGFDFIVPTTEDLAKKVYKQLNQAVLGMYSGIASDPPDPNFATVADPVFTPVEHVTADATVTAGEAEYLNGFFEASMRVAAYGTASRIANERYMGAVAAGDHGAAAMQAEASSNFTFSLIEQLRAQRVFGGLIATFDWMGEPIVVAPNGQDAATWWSNMVAALHTLTPADLSAADRQKLIDQGLTNAQIDEAVASWSDPDFLAEVDAVDPTATPREAIQANLTDALDDIDTFEAFGKWMSLNAVDEEALAPVTPVNHAPVSGFDATTISGNAPLTVTFTSQATDPDGDTLGLHWDIAGTRTVDDQASVTHTFDTPGSYGVSLVATDPDGAWDQAVKWISVYPEGADPATANAPPVALFSPQIIDGDGPITQTFTSASFDPDGDALTSTWYFGDGTTQTGDSVTKTFPAGYIMSVLLIVSDGELTGQAAGEVTSRHPGTPPDPNAPPVASFTADPTTGTSPLVVNFTSTSTDPDHDPLTHSWDFGDGGTGTGATVAHTYAAAGIYTATLVVSDGTLSQNTTRSIVVVAPNQPPVANPQTVNGFQDEASTITLTGSDPEGGSITFAVADSPSHGSLSGTAPNLTYTPDAGFFGDDTFTFTTNDGDLTSAPAKVTVKVGENRPPLAQNQTVGGVVPGVAKQIVPYGYDPDYRPITFTVVGQPGHGKLSGSFPYPWYTADDSFTDGDSLTYTVSDGVHTSAPATVSFRPATARPVADALTVQGSQIIDVAYNDEPFGAAVVDVTNPAHGTVSCSGFGMCLFVADDGYVGSDTFDYTLKVGVSEATATVTVTIVAPPAGSGDKPSAADDVLVTAAGTPGVVDVLANDTGDGTLTVTPSDGEHGTVTCEADGQCTYRPTGAAFEGFDVFSYTLSNGTDVDTALVRVRVGNPPEGLTVTTSSSSATPGGYFTWLFGLLKGGPVETVASPTGSVTATVSGPHSYVAGSARTANGWSLAVDGNQVTATPGADALIGDRATSILPRPLPPISQGTGGDGHVPILVGSKVFAFFHHQYPTQITCMDRATGQLCPSYPKTLTVGTNSNPGPGAVVGTQIWVHLYSRSYGGSGLFCWDTASNQTCGMVTNRPGGELWDGTAPMLIDGKMWFGTGAGRLRCVDPAAGAECAEGPFDTGITFGGDQGDIVNHGTKVYVSNFTKVNCVDIATGDRCDGWPEGGRVMEGNLVRSHDGTTGAVDGACGVSYWGMNCVRDDDPATVVYTNSRWAFTELSAGSSVEAETGTRTFYGTDHVYVNAGLGCFDWSTMAPCTGPNFAAFGHARLDIAGNVLPQAYGAVWDGSCAVALGDPGKVFTMDADGNSPCTSLDSGAAPLKADLRLQRFDGKVRGATWGQVRVFDADLTAGVDFMSFFVTVRDGATGVVVASLEMVGTDGVLDLSGIDPVTHPSLTVGATSRSVLHTGDDQQDDVWDAAWADGHAPKVQLLWNADAAPLGFQTRAATCLDGQSSPLVVRSDSGDLTARGELPFDSPPPCSPPDPTGTTSTTSTSTTSSSTSSTTSTTTMPDTTVMTTPGTTLPPSTKPGDPALILDARQEPSGQQAPNSTLPKDVHATSLPRTGTAAWRLALWGVVVFMCGAVVVVASRRRRFTR